jgi:uncharacterized protein YcnI
MKKLSTFALAMALAPWAAAHVSIDPPSAPAGRTQKLSFSIGHGCQGSATNAVTIHLPDGVLAAKPMPKAGWSVTTAEAPLAAPVQLHGKAINSAVRDITWKGGPLPDAMFDEFTLQARLPDAPGKLYFKVTQLCEQGRLDWVDVPQEGKEATAGKEAKSPAAVFEVTPANEHVHQH